MTKVRAKVYGRSQVLEQRWIHFVGEALDEFLIGEQVNTILGSLIKLSIGLEIYIKKSLEDIDPKLIYARLNQADWQKIEAGVKKKNTASAVRAYLIAEFSAKTSHAKTINFERAIWLLPHFYRVPKRILRDLNELRNYRNGLFHWTATDDEAFHLSKQSLRLLEWIIAFIERRKSFRDGGDLVKLDPFGEKRERLKRLKKSSRSENIFNLQRRVFRYKKMYQVFDQTVGRLNGDGFFTDPSARAFRFACRACSYPNMDLSESKNQQNGKLERRIFAECKRCGFHYSDEEYESIRGTFPSLKEEFDSLDTSAQPA